MTYVRLAVIAILLGFATSARADTIATGLTPPAEPPVRQPWRLGDWATYQLTSKAGTKTVNVKLLAEEACGYWIELEIEDGSGIRARTCVERQAELGPPLTSAARQTIVIKNGETTDISSSDADAQRVQLLERLLRADWAGKRGLPREDVTLPAPGATVLCVREDKVDGQPGHTRWSHPALVLGGLVREVNGDEELILTAHGDYRDTSALVSAHEKLMSQGRMIDFMQKPRKKWMALWLGSDLLGNVDHASWAQAFGGSLGYKLTPRWALALSTAYAGLAPHPTIPTLAESMNLAMLGVRWYPYHGQRATSRAAFLKQLIYAQLDLGYARLDRGRLVEDQHTAGRGGVAGLRVGISTGISPDWKIAIELHEHTALLNSDEDPRVMLGLNAVVELYLP